MTDNLYTTPVIYTSCTKCPTYSKKLRKCLDSNTNPRNKRAALAAMQLLGEEYLCDHSKWKSKLLQENEGSIQGIISSAISKSNKE